MIITTLSTLFTYKRLALILATLVLIWALYTAIRIHTLLGKFAVLQENTSHFPTHYSVGPSSDAPYTYIVLGDSTAAGVGASDLEHTYPYLISKAIAAQGKAVQVTNLAVTGATIEEVINNQLPQIKTLHPNLITISVGANNATHLTSSSEYAASLKRLLLTLQESGTPVLMANTPDMGTTPALPAPYRLLAASRAKIQNRLLSELPIPKTIQIVDLYSAGKLDYHTNPTLFAPDLFHPSNSGYQTWSNLFIKALQKQ